MLPGARTIVRAPWGSDGAGNRIELCGVPATGLSPPVAARQPGHQADQGTLERVLTLFVITPRHPVTLQ
jgi:hypothetical protein